MNTNIKIKALAIFGIIATGCGQVNAQRHHAHHTARGVAVQAPSPHHVTVLHISNHFSRKERLAMVIAYITHNRKITANQYAKITSLNKAAAKTELDAFALDRKTPIRAIVKGK